MVKITYDLENSNISHGQGQTHCQIWGLEFKSICLLFVWLQSDQFWLRYSKFHIWPWKFKVKAKVKSDGYIWGLESNQCVRFMFRGNRTNFGRDIANSIFDLENSRSRSWPRSNLMVTFEVLRSIDMFALRFVAIAPFFAEIYSIRYLTLNIQGRGHGQGQTWWSHLKPRVESMCLLFISWKSDQFWQRYSQFHIWPWKFKVKVMTKVKPDGPIWSLELSRCVCFSFCGNRTIFGWDRANSILTLKIQGQGQDEKKRPKSNQLIYRSGPTIIPKNERNPKNYSKVMAWTRICGRRQRRRRTNRYKNIKSPPVYRDGLTTHPHHSWQYPVKHCLSGTSPS